MALEISVDFEKFDIRGVVFFEVSRPYMQYVVKVQKIYNEVDRTFYESIKIYVLFYRTELPQPHAPAEQAVNCPYPQSF